MQSSVPQKAIVTPDDIDSIILFEKKFAKNDSTPAPINTKSFEFKKGTRKILFVAGHATAHIREGKIKQPDAGTGSLAVELNKLSMFRFYIQPFFLHPTPIFMITMNSRIH